MTSFLFLFLEKQKLLRIARFGEKVYQNKSSHGTLVRGDDDSYHAINADV